MLFLDMSEPSSGEMHGVKRHRTVCRLHYLKMILFCAVNSMGQRQDSLKQLTELVHKGEKKGLFSNKMPARIQQVVREENLLFMRNRNVYDADYFAFVRDLCSRNMVRALG